MGREARYIFLVFATFYWQIPASNEGAGSVAFLRRSSYLFIAQRNLLRHRDWFIQSRGANH